MKQKYDIEYAAHKNLHEAEDLPWRNKYFVVNSKGQRIADCSSESTAKKIKNALNKSNKC